MNDLLNFLFFLIGLFFGGAAVAVGGIMYLVSLGARKK